MTGERAATIEVFPAASPPGLVPHGNIVEAAYIKGNMGGLVVIRLRAGELAEHTHHQEHVGVVIEGDVEFIHGDQVTRVQAGDMYRVPSRVPHGVRCRDHALIVQARSQ